MSQAKKASDFRVIDLLEQVQRVDKLIAMYRTPPIDRVAESMILQYSVRRQEFVDQLNEITQKFSMSIELHPNIKQRPSAPKKYAVVETPLSMVNESQAEYKP